MTRNGLKWFLAVSATTLDYHDYGFRDLIRVAIRSALRNTQLRPHLIYDGPDDAFAAEVRSLGAAVILHRTPLYGAIEATAGDDAIWRDVAAGAFLRLDIPVIERHDAYALYTDCDVLFLREPRFEREHPQLFGATSQFSEDPAQDMNSGVMLLNLAAMRETLPALYAFSRERLAASRDLDQEMLKAFFGNRYQVLSRLVNWKPYWGWNPHAEIVHFHGPKPRVARQHLIDGTLHENDGWSSLLSWSRPGYEAYTRLWYLYRDTLVPAPVSPDTSHR